MTKEQARNIIDSEADLCKAGVQQSFGAMQRVADAVDTLCGKDAYHNGRLSPALSVFYADCRGYCRDLGITPNNFEISRELKDLVRFN